MGKHFDRLMCQQLEEYYRKNLEELKKIKIATKNFTGAIGNFIQELSCEITNKIGPGLLDQSIHAKDIFEQEQTKIIHDDFKSLTKKYGEGSSTETESDPIRVEILEAKLDFTEKKLNDMGVVVKTIDGRLVFEEE